MLAGYSVGIEIGQPGFIRAIVSRDAGATRIDWAHNSAWRFMPPVRDALGQYLLHDVDLAINKTLALAGSDEARDFVDIMYVYETVLPLAGLVRAAVGRDPGFSPRVLFRRARSLRASGSERRIRRHPRALWATWRRTAATCGTSARHLASITLD